MQKYICLRDDDTNYYTKTEDLKRAYGKYWGTIPIMLACIPFVHGSTYKILGCIGKDNKEKMAEQRIWEINANVAELNEYHKLLPIGLNTVLISELKELNKEGLISFAQHGITHRYYEDGPEMLKQHYSFHFLRDGKEYLEKVFNTCISIFIPPSNTIDYRTAMRLKKLHFTMCSGGGISYANKAEKAVHMLSYPSDIIEAAVKRINQDYMPYCTRQGLKLICGSTFPMEEEAEQFMVFLEKRLKKGRGAVVTAHYQLLCDNEKYRKEYQKLIGMMKDQWKIVDIERYITEVGK